MSELFLVAAGSTPNGARVRVSRHALLRYRERVKPGLTLGQATRDLDRLAAFMRVDVQPAWVNDPEAGRLEPAPEAWLIVGEDIALPVVNGVAVTCLTRGERSHAARVQRAAHRARVSAQRKAQRGTQGGKASDRKAPRRRPGPLPEVGS